MSQSGIPVISQAAQIVHNIAGGIGDIFEGKNVFESLGRIIVAPIAGALDLANDVSFNTLAHVPIAGDIFKGGSFLNTNPYDAGAAIRLGRGVAATSAIAAGGLAAAGLVTGGSATAIASASTLKTLGGVTALSSAGANRDIVGTISAGANLASDAGIAPAQGVIDGVNGLRPLVAPIIAGALAPDRAPAAAAAPVNYSSNNVNGPAQTYLAGFSTTQLILIAGGAAVLIYLAVK